MNGYHIFSLVSFLFCAALLLSHLLRLLRLGMPPEYSTRAGKISPAIAYSFTGAMSPKKKESAFLHLPTYIAGIIYHMGTFLAIILFFLFFFYISQNRIIAGILSLFLFTSTAAGLGLMIKRIRSKGLRDLSSPDDYLSNGLVTLFQLMSALVLIINPVLPAYFVIAGLLFLYLPAGKLKHVIYFFAARIQLGYFFGWRGIWPPEKG